ncbi:unnamed protein product [Linum trigynum]|uniref:Uncharacterized protein n=1 Tax=Linum trigynum TaxID=586398 RepID=A0AAV2CUJ1_9ROSI
MHHHHQLVEVEVESPPRESSRLAARPVAAGAGAAEPPAYAEIGPAPSRCEPGSPPAGSPSDQDVHHKQPSGSGTRHGEPNTAAGTGADDRRAADSGDAAARTSERSSPGRGKWNFHPRTRRWWGGRQQYHPHPWGGHPHQPHPQEPPAGPPLGSEVEETPRST